MDHWTMDQPPSLYFLLVVGTYPFPPACFSIAFLRTDQGGSTVVAHNEGSLYSNIGLRYTLLTKVRAGLEVKKSIIAIKVTISQN